MRNHHNCERHVGIDFRRQWHARASHHPVVRKRGRAASWLFRQDPGGGIACVNRNYITIDGGSNGLVQATANGTAQANQRGSNGVFLQSCNNVEVKNLRLSNLYVRTPNSSDSCDCGFGLRSVDGNNLNVHNNTVNDAEYGIYYRYDGTTDTGIVIQHNTIYHTATGIVVGRWKRRRRGQRRRCE